MEKQLDDLSSSLHCTLREKAMSKLSEIKRRKVAIAKELGVSPSLSLDALASQFLDSLTPNYREALVDYEKNLEDISFFACSFQQ